jgi:hypothetical protein
LCLLFLLRHASFLPVFANLGDDSATVASLLHSRSPAGIQVLVCQWQKMAFGHNLQAADWHVRFSHTWSYVQHSQGEDRSHRMGREEEVHYIDLIATKTVDEDIPAALAAKRDSAAHLSRPTVGSSAR